MQDDQRFLREAVQVGNELAAPYNFGAVVVKDGEIVAREHEHVHETHDPSQHAELRAIAEACKKLGTPHIDGATLYASHQPCTMCFSGAAWARIGRIVYGIPASAQEFPYEFRDLTLEGLAPKLSRPMQIMQLDLE